MAIFVQIDGRGRFTIPIEIRGKYGLLNKSFKVEFVDHDGYFILRLPLQKTKKARG